MRHSEKKFIPNDFGIGKQEKGSFLPHGERENHFLQGGLIFD
jgi:hypothetical protein